MLPRLENDYLSLIESCLKSILTSPTVRFDGKIRICLVGASFDDSVDYSQVKGRRLLGWDQINDNVEFFW
ncbi:MAG: hypothetical protein D6732_16985 [Methanobacteriota archaeon]|nr:MAG: hypothetical protein D6732_16985 [Euryarchaeota archaeon]